MIVSRPETGEHPTVGIIASPRRLAYGLCFLSILVFVLYGPTLKDLVLDWWNLEDYSYGFLVPVVVGYVVWRERSRYRAIPLAPQGSGLAIMLIAVGLLLGGTLAADLFTTRFSLMILLAGMAVYLCGWK